MNFSYREDDFCFIVFPVVKHIILKKKFFTKSLKEKYNGGKIFLTHCRLCLRHSVPFPNAVGSKLSSQSNIMSLLKIMVSRLLRLVAMVLGGCWLHQ